jgi:hypothetical protein
MQYLNFNSFNRHAKAFHRAQLFFGNLAEICGEFCVAGMKNNLHILSLMVLLAI